MSYNRLSDAELESGNFTLASTMTKIQANQDFFAGQLGTFAAVQLSNGSFEIASDAAQPNLPDNWTLLRFANGTFVLDETNPRHGAKIAKFTHPGGAGNGGGSLEADYFECSPNVLGYVLAVTFWTTNANVRIKIEVEYFTNAQVSISTETLHNQTSAGISQHGNPTSTARRQYALTVPATARYMRVLLVGGDTDTDPGSSTDIYFDNVWLIQESPGYPALAYKSGTKIIYADDALKTTASTTYVKLKEVEVVRPGTVNVFFNLAKTGASALVYGRIYLNDIGVGIERITEGSVSYSEDLTVQPGDTVSIWAKKDNPATSADVSNFRLRNNYYFEETLTA